MAFSAIYMHPSDRTKPQGWLLPSVVSDRITKGFIGAVAQNAYGELMFAERQDEAPPRNIGRITLIESP
jgi:hypothetical protein